MTAESADLGRNEETKSERSRSGRKATKARAKNWKEGGSRRRKVWKSKKMTGAEGLRGSPEAVR